MRLARLALVAIVTLPSLSSAAKQPVHVVDGDTIRIGRQLYRLHGIDAPELRQACRSDFREWPCGYAARRGLERFVGGKPPFCAVKTGDRYGRKVAVCFAGRADLGRVMIGNGLAWAYRKFSPDYASDEDLAHNTALGIWQALTPAPWDHRKLASHSP